MGKVGPLPASVFDIIVPTYNREALLPRALDSILAQTFTDYSVIVIDDCSTDATPSVMKKYLADDRFKYRRHPVRRGVTAGWNTGYDMAQGRLLTFLGDDDWLAPEALEIAYRQYERLGLEGSHWLMFDFVAVPQGEIDNSADRVEGYFKYEDMLCGGISGNFWCVFSRQLIEEPRIRHDERLHGNEGQMYLQIWKSTAPYYVPGERLYFADKGPHERFSTGVLTGELLRKEATSIEIYLSVFGDDLRILCPRALAHKLNLLGYLYAASGRPGVSVARHTRALRYGITVESITMGARSVMGWLRYLRGDVGTGQSRAGAAVETDWITTLNGIGSEWDRLVSNCPTRHPQYLFDWIEPWWEQIGSGEYSLSSVRVCDDGRTVAIAPLMLTRRRARGVVPVRSLRWLGAGNTDQGDIISVVPPRDAGVAVAAHLARHRRSWDELHLENVPAESQAVAALIEALQGRMTCVVEVKRAPNYYIDTSSGDWAGYLASTSKKFVQRDLPRVRRRLAELGEVTVTHDRGEEVRDLVGMAVALHPARQEELGRPSNFSEDRYLAFVTEVLERFRSLGILSVWTMRVGKHVACYLIGFETGGILYAWSSAHDPRYGAASPGKALLGSVIQACFEDETINEFNIMRGDTAYKRKWTSATRDLLDFRVRNMATIRSSVLNSMRRQKV